MNPKEIIAKGMSASAYHDLLGRIVESGKYKNEEKGSSLYEFIKLNHMRTKRILKQTKIPTELFENIKSVRSNYYWVVLSEPWCGDSANILPIISKLSDMNDRIELNVLLRDEHPEIMDQFLTNGTRAIPKLICFDEDYSIVGEWGPRPAVLKERVNCIKNKKSISSDELKEQIQIWYNADKGNSVYNELGTILQQWFQEVKV
ncbi:MAG: thioredoxin family protein [Flavobacteriales bacterium]|nr:thioredoxin family protein [Flavobacteriales bacterium]